MIMYSSNPKLRQLVAEIPWGHNLLILTKVKDDKIAEFYIKASSEYGWSRNVLLNQIKSDAYSRALSENKTHNFERALPKELPEDLKNYIPDEKQIIEKLQ